MSKVAFFGHRDKNYEAYEEKITEILKELIERHGANEFYNGYRGNFDKLCSAIVFKLKKSYPNIRNIMVLSYHPDEKFTLPGCFDDSVYLLDKNVPPRFAITHTNRKIVEMVDYIVSGSFASYGGAYEACEYARRKNKIIFNLIGQY